MIDFLLAPKSRGVAVLFIYVGLIIVCCLMASPTKSYYQTWKKQVSSLDVLTDIQMINDCTDQYTKIDYNLVRTIV